MNDYVEMPSGLIVPENTAESYYKAMQRPKAVDLFAGCGGMSLGFIQAGFEVIAGVDNWPVAAMTYMTNLGTFPCKFHFDTERDKSRMEKEIQKELKRSAKRNGGIATIPVSGSGWIASEPAGTPGVGHFFLGDVRKLTGKKILDPLGLKVGEIDCVAGGPPCQGFSISGKRNVMDPRNSLVFEFARLVVEIMPKTIVFENVPGIIDMVTPDGVPVIDQFCRILEDGGFGGLNPFLKSIESQTGNVGLLRGRKGKRKKQKSKNEQLELFQV